MGLTRGRLKGTSITDLDRVRWHRNRLPSFIRVRRGIAINFYEMGAGLYCHQYSDGNLMILPEWNACLRRSMHSESMLPGVMASLFQTPERSALGAVWDGATVALNTILR
jgi:hypothetical protein